jgi:hypothetical protein
LNNVILGTGKTVMILALILATLDQLPEPEESPLDPRPILTPLAFRHFPCGEFATARTRTLHGKSEVPVSKLPTVPSLVELLLHKIRVSPRIRDIRSRDELKSTGLWDPLSENTPFYLHFNIDHDADSGRSKRRKVDLGPRVMYLSTATLVIVPGHLKRQWSSEIGKHCQPDALEVLDIKPKMELPAAHELARYDVSNLALFISQLPEVAI